VIHGDISLVPEAHLPQGSAAVMCLSLQSFYLGAKRDGENIYGSDAKITEKNFIAQAALLLDSEDPCASFLNPQRTQHG